MNNLINDIKQDLIEKLNDLYGVDRSSDDLHHHLCNEDYFIIGTYKAKQWLGDHAFDVIEEVKSYEEDIFGHVSTDLSSPENVVNMFVYIKGQELLNDSKWYIDCLYNDETIREIDCQMIAIDLAA